MLTGVEIKRKIVHLSTLIVPIGYGLTSEETVLFFLLPFFLGYLLVDLLRHFHSGTASLFQKYFFGKVLREKEKGTLMGSTYFLFSSLLTILLFPKSIAIASLLILILSDSAAALVGKWIGGIPIFGKTLEGSMAFLVSSLLRSSSKALFETEEHVASVINGLRSSLTCFIKSSLKKAGLASIIP